jgi:lipopolysaccharide transport system permease protein
VSVEPAAPPAVTPPPAGELVEPEPMLTVVEPRSGLSAADFRELWRYRELFAYLVLRELKLRYKQTILGVGWSLFQPLSIMAMFVLFVGRAGGVGERVRAELGYPYELFVLAAALPWTFFATSVQNAGNSLIANERLVTKVYFPRLTLPLANAGAALVDLLVASLVLAIGMAVCGKAPGWSVVLVPGLLGLMFVTAAGVGTLFAALIVSQRDFRYLLTFGIPLWMLATPCIYDTPGGRLWTALNPAYGLILNFRAAVFGDPLDLPALAVSAAVGLGLAAAGLMYFRRVERTFADTI